MGPYYRAYLLRHWLLPDGQEWVELQQVATGERQRYHSLAEATAWLQGQGQARAPTPGEEAEAGGESQSA